MQILRPHPGPSESENVAMELKHKSNLCFNKLPWWHWWMLSLRSNALKEVFSDRKVLDGSYPVHGRMFGWVSGLCLIDFTPSLIWHSKISPWASLVVQWLRLQAPHAGGRDSIPDQGTRSHVLQLRVHMPQLKIPPATTKTQYRHIYR